METPCIGCGAPPPPGARYCPTCGHDLKSATLSRTTGQLPTNHLLYKRYLIVRTLARGGQSAVYLAKDTLESGAQRAIKELSDSALPIVQRQQAVNGFMREADILYRLHHPALTQLFEIFVEEGKHYLVMEYVPGHTLEEELLTAGEPLEWRHVARWGVELCDVFGYLHSQAPAVVYRDLKPPNVMLTPEGPIKLIDFGIARWFHPARTHDTTQLGTDGYAAMEQYAGRSEPRSDLYALGACLYHLLTGRVPTSAPQRMAGQPLAPIRSMNPDVPETLDRVIAQAMRLDATDRFADATRMRAALVTTLQPGNALTGQLRTQAGQASGIGRAGATGQAQAILAPKLSVQPLRLDAGMLDMYQTVVLHLKVGNRGGGELSGRAEANAPNVRVAPSAISGATSDLEVSIDTASLAPGPYRCHVALRTNGGDAIVPVRFVVRMPETSVNY
jgi:serine/threonine-protein kinase